MQVPVNYLTPPSVVVNRSLTMLGATDKFIGDINDGTPVAEAARYNYGRVLRQMLRANHWPFARKQAQLTLLGDSTGNSPAPVSTFVENGWIYAFAWPTDAVQGRWMPYNPASVIPVNGSGVPLTTGPAFAPWYPLTPARFLVSSSDQYPIETGLLTWDQLPDLQRTEGIGPIYRKIILTNCSPCVSFVYTRLVTVIEEWDDGFSNAMDTAMALVLAPTAIEDARLRIAERDRMLGMLKNNLDNARLQAGNEAGFPQSINKEANFMRARNHGAWGGFGWGAGGFYGGGLGDGYFGCNWATGDWGGSVF